MPTVPRSSHDAGPPPSGPSAGDADLILVVGGSPRTLDFLRFAALRSDDVILVAERINGDETRYADRFAITVLQRAVRAADLEHATAVLIAAGDARTENDVLRAARRHGVPAYVEGRPIPSDFTMLEFLKRDGASMRARSAPAGS